MLRFQTLAFEWQVKASTRKQVGCNFSRPQKYFGTFPLRPTVDSTEIVRTSENPYLRVFQFFDLKISPPIKLSFVKFKKN